MTTKPPPQWELLANLIQALCETMHEDEGNATISQTARRHSSPVEDIWGHGQRKNLVLTLHIVFPGMLLPALDLLDRRLVWRLTLKASPESPSLQRKKLQGEEVRTNLSSSVYAVKSIASTLPSRRGAAIESPTTLAMRTYLVHLEAWNCSCAAFAVDTYSSAGNISGTMAGRRDNESIQRMFRGLSATILDDRGAENLPCCKHLLACLLVHKWEGLAAHVENKVCTRDELAGIIVGI